MATGANSWRGRQAAEPTDAAAQAHRSPEISHLARDDVTMSRTADPELPPPPNLR